MLSTFSSSPPLTLFPSQPVKSQQVVAEKEEEEEEEFFGTWTATFSPSMFAASHPCSLPPSPPLSHTLTPSTCVFVTKPYILRFPFLLLSLPSSFSQPFFSSPLLSSRHRSGPRTSATAGKRESQLQTTGREGQNGSHRLTNFEHVLISSLCFRSSPSWEVCRSSPSTRICPTPSLMKRYV